MRLRAPPPLRQGDRIMVVAPCSAFNRQRFDDGVNVLREAGYDVSIAEHVFSEHFYLAGTDDQRAQDLQKAIDQEGVAAVWCARAGYGAARIARQLQYASLNAHPKWWVGFSDATVLHATWAQMGWMSAHGANIDCLAQRHQDSNQELFALLAGQTQSVTYDVEPLLGEGTFSGTAFGGNLTVLASMVGTRLIPNVTECLLFLEDIGERPYRIDRVLTQLVLAGVFEGVTGVMLGQFTKCVEPEGSQHGFDVWDILRDKLAPLGIPVVRGLPWGHETDARTLIQGAKVTVDMEAGRAVMAFEPT